jgi:tetratricopeptide (TPR) repeat protein
MVTNSNLRTDARMQDPLLSGVTAALRAGDQEKARELLHALVREQPDHSQAWLRLALLTPAPRQARAYICRALRFDPHNQQAIRTLRQIESRLATRSPAPPKTHTRFLRRWLAIWLLIGALVVVVGGFGMQAWAIRSSKEYVSWTTPTIQPSPSATATATITPTPGIPERVSQRLPELQSAWEERDWQRASDILGAVAALDSQYPGLNDAKCDTLVHWARDLVAEAQVKQAQTLYRRAYPFCRGREDVADEKALTLTYLSGEWRYNHEHWQSAIAPLQAVFDIQPDYSETRTMLYTSYISASHEYLAENHLLDAQQAAKAALTVRPDDGEAQALLQEVQAKLILTPTPMPANIAGKRIEINISEQRMYVWQGERLIYKWVCSTGEPGRGTAAGHYRILDKIPEAWASTWSLRMPYWMGIYWAGSLENGIHALPINPNGTRLWEGYLGTRVSFGCIILSTENARTLFNWASVGIPVWIHY